MPRKPTEKRFTDRAGDAIVISTGHAGAFPGASLTPIAMDQSTWVWLTPALARRLAKALLAFADKEEPHAKSR